jgi:hypothetical protein
MSTPQAKPGPRRYTADGQLLRTGHQIGSVAHRIERDTSRVYDLNAHIKEQGALDSSDKDLTAEFKAAEAAFAGGVPNILGEAQVGLDEAIMQLNANAGERIARSQMTHEQKLGAAVADALVERGIVPEPPTPTAADEYDAVEVDEPEVDQTGDGFYETSAGLFEVKDGEWSPVQMTDEAEEEPPPEDMWRNDSVSNEGFVNMADYDGEEEDDLDAA